MKNLFSYAKTEFGLKDYNIIVGTNNSGKTNLIRILNLLKEGIPFNYMNLMKKYKQDPEKTSTLSLDITLSDEEFRLCIGFLFHRSVSIEDVRQMSKKVTVLIHWKRLIADIIAPEYIVFRFGNGFTIYYSDNDKHLIYYSRELDPGNNVVPAPRLQETIKTAANPPIRGSILSDNYLPKFLNNEIEQIFTYENRIFSHVGERIQLDFHHQTPYRYQSEIFDFLKLKKDVNTSLSFWDFISKIIRNGITIVKEIKPRHSELANSLFKLKSDYESSYEKLKMDFNEIFPEVSFQVRPILENPNSYEIIIIENEREFQFENSASGFYATLFLLYSILNMQYHTILIDEPESHFHPTKISHLSQVLMKLSSLNNQVTVITHSPLFLDYKLFKNSRSSVVYVTKKDGISQAFSAPTDFVPTIKEHHFESKIFFEKCSMLVEGPSDEYVMQAISDGYGGLFKKHNLALVNTGGKDQLPHYIQLLDKYNIPFVAITDSDYTGPTDNVTKLTGDLEDEVQRLGWQRRINSNDDNGEKLRPEKAYEFIYDLITNKNSKSVVEQSKFWQVIQTAISKT